jgi:hypothetical protein
MNARYFNIKQNDQPIGPPKAPAIDTGNMPVENQGPFLFPGARLAMEGQGRPFS